MAGRGRENGGGQTIAGIERAIDVLTLFTAEGVRDLGVTEIAEELGLSKAVVHRVLSSFRATDFVELDEETRRYRLGMRTLQFGMAYLSSIDVLADARERLNDLVALTQETATVSVRSGWRRVYVGQATPPRDIKMVVGIGSAHPLHAGASSKALLAYMSDDFQNAYLAQGEFERLTDRTITTTRQLREELALIRERGYATSLGERQAGAGSVAAPVIDYAGQPVASISVCGPLERFEAEAEDCAEHLLNVVHGLSRRLGHGV